MADFIGNLFGGKKADGAAVASDGSGACTKLLSRSSPSGIKSR
jgi:hypothetical protein